MYVRFVTCSVFFYFWVLNFSFHVSYRFHCGRLCLSVAKANSALAKSRFPYHVPQPATITESSHYFLSFSVSPNRGKWIFMLVFIELHDHQCRVITWSQFQIKIYVHSWICSRFLKTCVAILLVTTMKTK